jgi:plasmid stabilization system protein ParE
MARFSIRHYPEATDELKQAADWYHQRDPRVAARFIAAIKAKLKEIAATPHRWPLEPGGIRQALVRKYKYSIVFREHHGVVEILAYAHGSRDPGYWRNRLKP